MSESAPSIYSRSLTSSVTTPGSARVDTPRTLSGSATTTDYYCASNYKTEVIPSTVVIDSIDRHISDEQ